LIHQKQPKANCTTKKMVKKIKKQRDTYHKVNKPIRAFVNVIVNQSGQWVITVKRYLMTHNRTEHLMLLGKPFREKGSFADL
jgi:hypothetical protein